MNFDFSWSKIRSILFTTLWVILWGIAVFTISQHLDMLSANNKKYQSTIVAESITLDGTAPTTISESPFGFPLKTIYKQHHLKVYWVNFEINYRKECVLDSYTSLRRYYTYNHRPYIIVEPLPSGENHWIIKDQSGAGKRSVSRYFNMDLDPLPEGEYQLSIVTKFICDDETKSGNILQQTPFTIKEGIQPPPTK